MARLQRQWGVQARWRADGPHGTWSPTWWTSREIAEASLAEEGLASYERRLVSRIVGDLEVVDDGQASA